MVVGGDFEDRRDAKQIIGDNIRAARESLGWTQHGLSSVVGMTQGKLSQFERGKRRPSAKETDRLCMALGVHPEVILAGVHTKPEERLMKLLDRQAHEVDLRLRALTSYIAALETAGYDTGRYIELIRDLRPWATD